MYLYKGLRRGGKCAKCQKDVPVGADGYLDGKNLYCVPCGDTLTPAPSSTGSTGSTSQAIQRTVRCPYCHRESTETTITNIGKEFPDGTMKWVRVCASCARLREVVYRMKLDGLWPDKVPRPKSADSIQQPPVVGP